MVIFTTENNGSNAVGAIDNLKKGKLTIQCPKGRREASAVAYRSAYDELWSFVDNKGNKQWVWLALDVDTREIVGVYLGDRDEKAARKLWESLSFSKSLENHIGAIWYFVHYYNSLLLV
jgi:hypothetical protein